MNSTRGFTVIEVLIVIAITGILATITFTTFTNVYRTHALDKTRTTAISILEQARSNSMASKNSQRFGVHFATTTITLFQGNSYTAGSSTNSVFTVSPYVLLSDIDLNGGGNEVVFGRLIGTTTHYGTLTYTLSTDTSKTKTITVYATGIIE